MIKKWFSILFQTAVGLFTVLEVFLGGKNSNEG
jgi:hypothetical protein